MEGVPCSVAGVTDSLDPSTLEASDETTDRDPRVAGEASSRARRRAEERVEFERRGLSLVLIVKSEPLGFPLLALDKLALRSRSEVKEAAERIGEGLANIVWPDNGVSGSFSGSSPCLRIAPERGCERSAENPGWRYRKLIRSVVGVKDLVIETVGSPSLDTRDGPRSGESEPTRDNGKSFGVRESAVLPPRFRKRSMATVQPSLSSVCSDMSSSMIRTVGLLASGSSRIRSLQASKVAFPETTKESRENLVARGWRLIRLEKMGGSETFTAPGRCPFANAEAGRRSRMRRSTSPVGESGDGSGGSEVACLDIERRAQSGCPSSKCARSWSTLTAPTPATTSRNTSSASSPYPASEPVESRPRILLSGETSRFGGEFERESVGSGSLNRRCGGRIERGILGAGAEGEEGVGESMVGR